jgi:predicted DNA-binding protein (MmcQ/YjbR family)
MNVEALRRYCLSFAQATENLQWGEDLCFKVGGKIFTVVSLGGVPQSMSVKCAPEKFSELIEQEGIKPAPYVGRYKWVLLESLDVLRDSEIKDLIRQSYEMVSAKVPKSKKASSQKRKTKA